MGGSYPDGVAGRWLKENGRRGGETLASSELQIRNSRPRASEKGIESLQLQIWLIV